MEDAEQGDEVETGLRKQAWTKAELEPGDHLLRWGPTDSGARRHCHHTDEPELDQLCRSAHGGLHIG